MRYQLLEMLNAASSHRVNDANYSIKMYHILAITLVSHALIKCKFKNLYKVT